MSGGAETSDLRWMLKFDLRWSVEVEFERISVKSIYRCKMSGGSNSISGWVWRTLVTDRIDVCRSISISEAVRRTNLSVLKILVAQIRTPGTTGDRI